MDKQDCLDFITTVCNECVTKGHNLYAGDTCKMSNDDIDFLITPIDCVGEPHNACMDAGIPIIAVQENKNVLNDPMPDSFIIVDNYIEAAGLLMAYKAGINPTSIRRQDLKIL